MEEEIKGKIILYTGPMFSGKTTQLICTYEKYKHKYDNIAVIKSKKDIRYDDTDKVNSHNCNLSLNSTFEVKNLFDIKKNKLDKYDIILIDEGHFFSDILDFTLEYVDKMKKIVAIAALDMDFLREPFDQITTLMGHADELIKFKSVCTFCKSENGIYSMKISGDFTKKEECGGKEKYTTTCRCCYLKHNKI